MMKKNGYEINEDGLLTLNTSFRMKFTIDEPVPVDVAIKSIRNFEKLLLRTTPLVEAALDNQTITSTEIFVQEIVEGSFIIDFLIKHVLGEKNAEKAQEVFHDVIKDNTKVRTAVGVGVGIAIGVASAAYFSAEKQPTPPAIEAHQSVILQAAGDIHISSEDLEKYKSSIESDEKKLTEEVVGAMSPAKLTNGSTLEIEGVPTQLNVNSESIDAIPVKYVAPEQENKIEEYQNTDIYVFASDQDKRTSGWAGIVPELFEHRVKFKLSEEIDPFELHGHRKLKADIAVVKQFNRSTKKFEVKEVLIINVAL